MSTEIKTIQIQQRDLGDVEMWANVIVEFEKKPELIQQIKVDCGNGLVGRIAITNHQEEGKRGFYQIEDVFPITMAEQFQNYCEQFGEVLPGGIYRIFYSED